MSLFIICSILSIIAFQDFLERQVYWFLFPLLFLLGITRIPIQDFWPQAATRVLFNLLFLLLVLTLVFIYFRLLKGMSFQSLKSQIGLGDILFFISLSSFFPYEDYMLFFSLSLFLALFLSIPFLILKQNFTIPLAGLQASFLAIIMILEMQSVQVFGYLKPVLF